MTHIVKSSAQRTAANKMNGSKEQEDIRKIWKQIAEAKKRPLCMRICENIKTKNNPW